MSDRTRAPDEFWIDAALMAVGSAVAFTAIQAVTVEVLALVSGAARPSLSVWEILGLWAVPDPSTVTGLPGGAILH